MKIKKIFQQISKAQQAVRAKYFEKLCILSVLLACNPLTSFATVLNGDTANVTEWPWTKFMRSLVTELTGPVPMFIGAIGILGAIGAMINGNFGASVQKLIAIIFGVSIALFAPSFISYINGSVTNVGGLTIFVGM